MLRVWLKYDIQVLGKSEETGLLTVSSEQWQEISCFISSHCLILTLFWFKADAPLSHCTKSRCFHLREICNAHSGSFAGWVSEHFLKSKMLHFVREPVCQDQWCVRDWAATIYKCQVFFTVPGVVTYFSTDCVQKVITYECRCSDPCRMDHIIHLITPLFPKLKFSEAYFSVSEIFSPFFCLSPFFLLFPS